MLGLAPGESIGETSQVMNCSVEHLRGASTLWESPQDPEWVGCPPHGLGRWCCRARTQSHLAKHHQALRITCPHYLPSLDLCLEGSPLARL